MMLNYPGQSDTRKLAANFPTPNRWGQDVSSRSTSTVSLSTRRQQLWAKMKAGSVDRSPTEKEFDFVRTEDNPTVDTSELLYSLADALPAVHERDDGVAGNGRCWLHVLRTPFLGRCILEYRHAPWRNGAGESTFDRRRQALRWNICALRWIGLHCQRSHFDYSSRPPRAPHFPLRSRSISQRGVSFQRFQLAESCSRHNFN